ncbi:hypothetical protein HHK36_003764 [Tetracentron sinense]|uniref:Uncharacterized protein n=1 Tax=Tetracentron sinense TaxID=13715 RepID=A0A834ZPA5_TETSI|nr:hypothetical protein HHK36_003764 [Tetracentron sinense]
MENSTRKRLNMQNEVLKWLKEFSEKLQKRANDTTKEVHALLDQTEIVEQDMKNTLNSFKNLTYTRYTENRISEEDETSHHMNKDTKKLAQGGIPAQSYEADILPRYKEAISLGLSSYRDHMQKTNRTSSAGSLLKTGLAHGPLPHIVGSEEYIHDNSCGLAEDTIFEGESFDFNHVLEPKGVSSNTGRLGSNTMFSPDLFEGEQGTSEKAIQVGNEPLVSAASDFKAMLEAALLSPYKFYALPDCDIATFCYTDDEESSPLSDAVHAYSNNTDQICADLPFWTGEEPSAIQESHEAFSTKDEMFRHAGAETFLDHMNHYLIIFSSWHNSMKNSSSDSSLQENIVAKESCNSTELLQKQSNVERDPSTTALGNGSAVVDEI